MEASHERTGQPSRAPGEEPDYYAAVERHFVGLRGSPLFITPQDWHLIYRWRQMQIPLHVVREGLDRAFEKRKSPRPVRRLAYCRQSVEGAFRRHCEALVGAAPEARGESPAEELDRYLRELEAALRKLGERWTSSHPRLAETALSCAERLAGLSLRDRTAGALVDIERELGLMDEELFQRGESCLDGESRRRCREEAESGLAAYRLRMPEAVYASALESAYRKRLRQALGLPTLSLFHA